MVYYYRYFYLFSTYATPDETSIDCCRRLFLLCRYCFSCRFPPVVVVFELQNNYEDYDDNGFDIIIILRFRE